MRQLGATLLVPISIGLAFGVFVSSAIVGALLDMYVLQILKAYTGDFSSRSFVDFNLEWTSKTPLLMRGLGMRTVMFVKTRTLLFPLLEGAFAVMVVVSLYLHGPTVRFARDVVFLMMALPLAMISWQAGEAATAPDIITLPGTMLGVLTAAIPGSISMPDVRDLRSLTHSHWVSMFIPVAVSIAGAAICFFLLFAAGEIYRRRRGHEGIGMGAVKSAMMIGAFCGVAGGVFAVFLAWLLGSLFGLLMMIRYRSEDWRTVYRTKKLPFVPFIVAAGIVSILWVSQY